MTLVVAGVQGAEIWMVGDTAITEGPINLREREFMPKVESSIDGLAIGAFAGSPERGSLALRNAMLTKDKLVAKDLLCKESLITKVDFLYAFLDERREAHLFIISKGTYEKRMAAYIGSKDAFEQFQKIRSGNNQAYAPEAFKQFMIGAPRSVPADIATATASMIDLFASRSARDIGGWATPYVLQNEGASFLTYSYAVSDPRFKQWTPGSIIPHGTASEGGATLSVTNIDGDRGTIIYWLQRPGGIVCLRTKGGYDLHAFPGDPSAFKEAVKEKLGLEVALWIGDQSPGPLTKILVKRDALGNLETTIGMHGNAMTFAVHNMTTPFASKMQMTFENENILPPDGIRLKRTSESSVEIKLKNKRMNLTAKDIEKLVTALALERSNILPSVPAECKDITSIADADPAWRVDPTVHPGMPGALLALRHKAFGWQSYALSFQTVKTLGEWLTSFAARNQAQ